jgi:hypothetical protein
MSDRTRNPQTNQQNGAQAIDLTELHASVTAGLKAEQPPASQNTDLASASSPSANIVRLSAKPEKRPLSHLSPGATTTTEPATKSVARKGAPSNRPNGIITNPYYRYEGGLLDKIITFFANILKFLERALLRSLTQTKPAPPQRQVVPSTEKTEEKEKKEKARENLDVQLPVRE